MSRPTTAPHPSDCLYAAAGGHLVCVEVATGQEAWRSRIPKGHTYVASVLVRDGLVIVACTGRIHCFDAGTGAILWSNDLTGLGFGHVFLGSAADTHAAAVAAHTAAITASSPDTT